jgi:hypothetical protein
MTKDKIEFEPDLWMIVVTTSPERAREYFGAGETREVEDRGPSDDPDKPGRIYAVKALQERVMFNPPAALGSGQP